MNINVNYCSSAKSPSGYGSAARNFITALFSAGVNLTCTSIQQTAERSEYGITGSIANFLENRKIPYRIKIIHLTPDLIPTYKEQGIYTISHLFWETDKLPKEWIEPLNSIDEIWTASPQMGEIIKKSGVTTPCYFFPQPIFTGKASESIEPFKLNQPKDFIFYSIFQWIDRKNPKGLLKAYWKAFTGNDKVTLLIKTYRVNYSEAEFNLIRKDIENWKKELDLKHYPKIYLIRHLLSEKQMIRLHKLGHIYISSSSGEGWARPVEEAMLYGKPVISGDNGGITDILTPQYYYKVSSSSEQATIQSHIPWYTSDQKWKVIDENDLILKMQDVYENYHSALDIAKKAREFVVNNFSFRTVGDMMLSRLTDIYKILA